MFLDFYVFLQSSLILFVILDPLGNAPIFYSLTMMLSEKDRRSIIKMSVIVATIILLIFSLGGPLILQFFSITVDDFRIAGGTILFIIAVKGILGRVEAESVEREAVAIVPMATPLLAGPGSITTVIYIAQAFGIHYSVLSIIINSIIAYILLVNGDKLLAILGKNGSIALARIMAMVLAAIAVSMIREGVVHIAENIGKI